MWNSDGNKINLILIRHGKTIGNIEKRYVGSTNYPLTEQGKNELNNRRYPDADIVFVSPMLRCIETGQVIYPNSKQEIIDEFREMDFGLFEGRNYEELKGNDSYQAWIDSGGRMPFPGGEDVDTFVGRVMKGFDKMLESVYSKIGSNEHGCKPLKVALVVHGGTIMAIQSALGICDFYDRMYENGECREILIEVDNDLSHNGFTVRVCN